MPSSLTTLFSCIDNTTLSGTDSVESVAAFCKATAAMQTIEVPHVASVCVYPLFVETAKKSLAGTSIRVASVAGGFPAGQIPLNLKLDEIRYAIDSGADEIDFVINRGRFLQGGENHLFDEVAAAKEACKDHTLKVIIETGELVDAGHIYSASMVSLNAGADFIKTSTGKIPVGATPFAAYTMLCALRDFIKNNKKEVGFKAAGGISTPSDALFYYNLAEKILKDKNITNQNFRIGASRLTAKMFKILTE
ncbi:MAG: deoxyribose-phosphate aldolase [Bacteroidales bacterium]|nr:deoxyribose-phosphate aldolase [Bacteroidales bacterium]